MNLTLRQLRYILLVAETGSVAAAARESRISQSSVLAAVDLAEGEMTARLFDRKPARGMIPTPAGERFLASARLLLAAEAEFARTLQGLAQDMPPVLRVGCFEPFGALFMPDFLHRFLDGADAEVQLFAGEQPQLLRWLETGAVDVIVAYDVGPGLPADAVPIVRIPAHALLPASDSLAEERSISLGELAERPMVLLDLPQTSQYLTALFDQVGSWPKIAFRTRSYDSVRAAVACGFGASILNMRPMVNGSPDSNAIRRVPLSDAGEGLRLIVADRYGGMKPRFLTQFISRLQHYFAEAGPSHFAVTTAERSASLIFPHDRAHQSNPPR